MDRYGCCTGVSRASTTLEGVVLFRGRRGCENSGVRGSSGGDESLTLV